MTRVHISLPVSDLDRAVRFYNQMLGREPDKLQPDYANYRVDQPGLMLALVASGADQPAGARYHYGIELDSAAALASWRERISSTPLAMRREDDVVCCYARANKFWLSDPDGHDWEFWVRTGDADAMFKPALKPQARSSCCA